MATLYVLGPDDLIDNAVRHIGAAHAVTTGPAHARATIDGLEHDTLAWEVLRRALGCDGIALVTGWQGDRTARLVVETALRIGMPMRRWEEWV